MINETKFPEWRRFQCGDYTDWTVTISRLEMDAWLKRAIADFPKGVLDRPYFHGGVKRKLNSDEVYVWFEKWFSQFIEKGEENE